ncbi:hypothetical protein bcgnr5372_37770 [Bacillus luti]|nr:hypothetical protein [Bacillus cereus]HDR8329465.1 hypothetical protein [Bacillus cereus]HDR8338174.1 hypothetical protein [Bacillus cereus]
MLKEITKPTLLEVLKKIKDDAMFYHMTYTNRKKGIFRGGKISKELLMNYLKNIDELEIHDGEFFKVAENNYVQIGSVYNNINYETEDIQGFTEIKLPKNVYFNIFYKIDKDEGTITYKLGENVKTLQIKTGSDFVSKPSKDKYMLTCDLNYLEHTLREIENVERNVSIGRRVLGIAV